MVEKEEELQPVEPVPPEEQVLKAEDSRKDVGTHAPEQDELRSLDRYMEVLREKAVGIVRDTDEALLTIDTQGHVLVAVPTQDIPIHEELKKALGGEIPEKVIVSLDASSILVEDAGRKKRLHIELWEKALPSVEQLTEGASGERSDDELKAERASILATLTDQFVELDGIRPIQEEIYFYLRKLNLSEETLEGIIKDLQPTIMAEYYKALVETSTVTADEDKVELNPKALNEALAQAMQDTIMPEVKKQVIAAQASPEDHSQVNPDKQAPNRIDFLRLDIEQNRARYFDASSGSVFEGGLHKGSNVNELVQVQQASATLSKLRYLKLRYAPDRALVYNRLAAIDSSETNAEDTNNTESLLQAIHQFNAESSGALGVVKPEHGIFLANMAEGGIPLDDTSLPRLVAWFGDNVVTRFITRLITRFVASDSAKVREMTLMTDMAMMQSLSSTTEENEQGSLNAVLSNYDAYLKEDPRAPYFSETSYGWAARAAINEWKEVVSRKLVDPPRPTMTDDELRIHVRTTAMEALVKLIDDHFPKLKENDKSRLNDLLTALRAKETDDVVVREKALSALVSLDSEADDESEDNMSVRTQNTVARERARSALLDLRAFKPDPDIPTVNKDDVRTNAKLALKALIAHNYHHRQDYTNLIQSLSVFIESDSLLRRDAASSAVDAQVSFLASVSNGEDPENINQRLKNLAQAVRGTSAEVDACASALKDTLAEAARSTVHQEATVLADEKMDAEDNECANLSIRRAGLLQVETNTVVQGIGITDDTSAMISAMGGARKHVDVPSEPKEDKVEGIKQGAEEAADEVVTPPSSRTSMRGPGS